MTSFVLQTKDPRWSDDGNALAWEALVSRILPLIPTSLTNPEAALDAAQEMASAVAPVGGEICLVFTNDAEISGLNKTWRGKEGPTNVLSFPADEDFPDITPTDEATQNTGSTEDIVVGDVVLAYETIAREARNQGKSFHNHVAHMLVHGVLHLLGYDHQNDEEAGQMESLERKILAALDIADPYVAEPQG